MPDTRLAVDTNFLLDLTRSKEAALDALEVIRRRLRGAQIFPSSRNRVGSWGMRRGEHVEFAAKKEYPRAVVFKAPEAARIGLD